MKHENQDYWQEVEECMKEETASGYKMAVVEADKILRFVLKQKGYPGKSLKQQILLAGWDLKDKKGLEKALEKHEEIVHNLDYKLSTFEAEDAIKAYKEAIVHFSSSKTLGFGKRMTLYYTHYLSFRSSFFQKTIGLILGFFILVKIFDSTRVGEVILEKIVLISNFIFSWLMVFLLLGIAIVVIVIGSFLYFGREKVKIRE